MGNRTSKTPRSIEKAMLGKTQRDRKKPTLIRDQYQDESQEWLSNKNEGGRDI